jgi:hypothetical protein
MYRGQKNDLSRVPTRRRVTASRRFRRNAIHRTASLADETDVSAIAVNLRKECLEIAAGSAAKL